MFECCICKKGCENSRPICSDCVWERQLLECFIEGAQTEVKRHLKNGRTVCGVIYGVEVKIVPNPK